MFVLLKESYELLHSLRLPSGFYLAAPNEDYYYVWIRDSVYMSLPFADKEGFEFEHTMHRLLDLFHDYEWKIDHIANQRPYEMFEYLHARYDLDGKEMHVPWGHAQHDMIGLFLFAVKEGLKNGKRVLRSDQDKRILQKLVYYLGHVRYYEDPDNGMWEEWREIHSSSIGACVAGLNAVKDVVDVPEDLISKGIQTLNQLFPRESDSRPCDLSQLSLIYPYGLYSGAMAEELLKDIESKLLRSRGVARYMGDSYYSSREKDHGREQGMAFYEGSEAEWTFGLPWLSLCHSMLGNTEKAKMYLRAMEDVCIAPGQFPEAYFSNTNEPNPNSPLGWCSAMYILAKEKCDQ